MKNTNKYNEDMEKFIFTIVFFKKHPSKSFVMCAENEKWNLFERLNLRRPTTTGKLQKNPINAQLSM